MKTVKIRKQQPAPKPPVVSSSKGSPVKKASQPTTRRSALIEAKTMPHNQTITSRGKSLPPVKTSTKKKVVAPKKETLPVSVPKQESVAVKTKKRAPQHDSAYFAKLGERGGNSLVRKRGTNFFADIAKLSHPRKEYNGGRPKGSTKAKKLEEEAKVKRKLARKKK